MEEIKTTKETPKYILLQSECILSYDNTTCFVNGKENKIEGDSRTSKEIADDLQKTFYNTFLKRHFKNVVVLTAAGTSMDNGIEGTSGKTRAGLWDYCITEIDRFLTAIPDLKTKGFYIGKDIEELLSFIILNEKVNKEKLHFDYAVFKEALEKKIAEACKLKLQPQAPHKDFLNKIIARKPSDPRVQLFTTNYDLLFETAANESGFVVIDGFSFTQPRKFSGRYFDLDIVNREKTRIKQEESFVSKVFHFYKLHGSLNWFKDDTENVVQQDNPIKPLIIYPASEKYESSYEQPYFEMMSRFQQVLRKENTLLIVIGFGFQDKHIQNSIIEAVEQNPDFHLLIVHYNGTGDIDTSCLKSFFTDEEKKQVKRKVNIVFDTFNGFTKNFPSNNTYIETNKEIGNESL